MDQLDDSSTTRQPVPQDKKPFFKKFWYLWLILIVIFGLVGAKVVMKNKDTRDDQKQIEKSEKPETNSGNNMVTGKYPKCPANLDGILTYQLMDPKYIAAMTPLGNVSPPGHTSPVDHIYFSVNSDDQIPLYAPADGWITHIMANSVKKTATSDYEFDSFVVTYTICDGLVLDFAGYTDVIQSIQDQLTEQKDSCKSGITKVGHDTAAEQQCDYPNLNIKVTSGQLIGHTHRVKRPEGNYNIPFEIWTADYNKEPRSDIDWSYYNDNRYAHWLCTFDLYSGDLKKQFDAKFGSWQDANPKNSAKFTQRTAAPLCGTVTQDIVGSIQGMWFSGKPDLNDKSGNVGGTGQGISFIHNNVDPTVGEVVVGGEMSGALSGVLAFTPTHSGTINREPSEIKADGKVYCFQNDSYLPNITSDIKDKILVQLVDDHHIKAENKPGTCSANESFSKSYNFER